MNNIDQSRATEAVNIRLPVGLRSEIKRAATEARRTMNSELVFQLERIYHPQEAADQK